jgi:hypothetical protein
MDNTYHTGNIRNVLLLVLNEHPNIVVLLGSCQDCDV